MAFTGTYAATGVARVKPGDTIQWGNRPALVQRVSLPALTDGEFIVALTVRREGSRKDRVVELPIGHVLLVKEI